LLTACQTPSKPPLPPLGPVEQPAPPKPDPRLCAALKPEPPARGGIVAPATPEEKAATAEFLTGEAEARAWGREGWARAALAVALLACPPGAGGGPEAVARPPNRP